MSIIVINNKFLFLILIKSANLNVLLSYKTFYIKTKSILFTNLSKSYFV
jgi:hypothetical protein